MEAGKGVLPPPPAPGVWVGAGWGNDAAARTEGKGVGLTEGAGLAEEGGASGAS